MTLYTTLAEVKDSINASTTADDNKIMRLIRRVSRRVDGLFQSPRPIFLPYLETRKIPFDSEHLDSVLNLFRLDGSLLELDGVTAGTTALTVGSTVTAYPDATQPPFTALALAYGTSWYGYLNCDANTFISVTGIWGFSKDYGNAWPSVDTLAANITSSATSLTVANIDGGDPYGLTPRISAGNVLRIGDEFIEVTATDITTNVATVIRGVLGTSGNQVAHTAGDAVKVFQIDESVRYAVTRQVGLMYARQGAYTTVEVNGMSEVRFPQDLLHELYGAMKGYAYGA